MEGERSLSGVPSYQLQEVSFSAAATPKTLPIHEIGLVQFEDHDHHNHKVLSFSSPVCQLSTAGAAQFSSSSTHDQRLQGTATAADAGDSANAAMGLSRGHLVSRPPWSKEQLVIPYYILIKFTNAITSEIYFLVIEIYIFIYIRTCVYIIMGFIFCL